MAKLIDSPAAGGTAPRAPQLPDCMLLCFSHLRWSFVFQRPQHLMSRFAHDRRVVYWEEPVDGEAGAEPHLVFRECPETGVRVATPTLPRGLPDDGRDAALRRLLEDFLAHHSKPALAWYYTPIMLSFSRGISALGVVYDCMDELANFRFAPPGLLQLETELLERADIVFTGGFSLYEVKKDRHASIHPFPSSVDRAHFAKARSAKPQPSDQAGIATPRLGYFGVIDERMDLELLTALADARPDWSIIMVGPVVKIDAESLPRRANIHYLGGKSYEELPGYLAGWDVALMPFARNESTRFISPTKTPEYLSGGAPVVSTPVTDVIRHYGSLDGVRIADGSAAFVSACEKALALGRTGGTWLAEADALLADTSWDRTHAEMSALIALSLQPPAAAAIHAIRRKRYDHVVVGAGFAGSVLAERLASQHDA